MKIFNQILTLIAICLLLPGLLACASRSETVGYVLDENKLSGLKTGVTTKEEVYETLGSPSSRSIFGDETWYYISAQEETLAFLEPKVKKQQIVKITFDQSGLISFLDQYELDKAKKISLNKDETEALGDNTNPVRQFIGNIGKFKSDRRKAGGAASMDGM